MTRIHDLPRASLAAYRDQRVADHYDHRLTRYDVDSSPVEGVGEDNDVTQKLRKWRAGFAARVAVVRGLKVGG